MQPQEPQHKSEVGDIWLGIVTTLILIPVVGWGISWVLAAISPDWGSGFILFDLAMFVAGLVVSYRKRRMGIFKGMLIGLGIGMLLVAACFTIVFLMFSMGNI